MAAGEAIGCFGLTEPDFGSDPGAMRTRARRDGDGADWVLNGTKMWITNGSVADVAVVWAREDTDEGRIRGFVVPTDTAGFCAPEIKRKMSLRASVTSELVLDDVRLPASAHAAGGQRPLRAAVAASTRPGSGSCSARSAPPATAWRRRSPTPQERQIFDKSARGFQLTQAKLADMTLELGKGMLLAIHLGALKDDGQAAPRAGVSLGKLNNVREAIAIARECRTILGRPESPWSTP